MTETSPPPLPEELVEPLAEILADAVVAYLRKCASVLTSGPALSVPPQGVPVALAPAA